VPIEAVHERCYFCGAVSSHYKSSYSAVLNFCQRRVMARGLLRSAFRLDEESLSLGRGGVACGIVCDDGIEQGSGGQRYRASGLNLVIAAITLWNTVYLERAVNALRERRAVNDALLGHIAPLGWNHIGLTGDYNWHANKRVAKGGFRPLRRARSMESTVAAP
jgi:hypothetical protein